MSVIAKSNRIYARKRLMYACQRRSGIDGHPTRLHCQSYFDIRKSRMADKASVLNIRMKYQSGGHRRKTKT